MKASCAIALSTLLCGLTLAGDVTAQIPQGPGQDPAARLQRRLNRLRNEIVQVEKLREEGGLVSRLQSRLRNRQQELRSVEVKRGVPANSGPGYGEQPAAPQTQSTVGLMSEELKGRHAEDVICVVESVPATEGEFNALLSYLTAQNPDAPAERLQKDAMVALLTRKVARARAGEGITKVTSTANEVLAKLNEGADFAEMARNYSEGPTRTVGGDLNFFGRGQMDLNFEVAAFSLEKGQTSGLVESPFGLHIIKVTDTNENGQVRASHILRLFQADASAARAAATEVRSGRVKALFRDAAWRQKYGF
ncbi:MAG: peptidylprolyl isomerase [Planctomycetota bacterium]